MEELNIFANYFEGFFYGAVFPIFSGVFLGIKRALWASAFGD